MERIKRVSKNCLALLEEFECGGDFLKFLKAYQCPAGRWTIGMGTTRYPGGDPVKQGDRITQQQVFEYVTHDLSVAESAVDKLVIPNLNQGQFDALVCFIYNLGFKAFKTSTLLKIINSNPDDPAIDRQFNRWTLASACKQPVAGLIRRRKAESWLYFNGVLKFQF
ncbi:MAG: lysozyme [Bacteroidales bacterium]